MTYYARVRRVDGGLGAELSWASGRYVYADTVAELNRLLWEEIAASDGAISSAEPLIYFELPEDLSDDLPG